MLLLGRYIVYVICLIGLVGLFVIIGSKYSPAHARPRPYATHEFDDSPHHEWFEDARKAQHFDPGKPRNQRGICCNESDCHATNEDYRGDRVFMQVGYREEDGTWVLTEWVDVTEYLADKPEDGNGPNPTGHAIICHQPYPTSSKQDENGNYYTVPPTEHFNGFLYCAFRGALL
jgi:hypothetical protein